jgi:hypothetical protein
MIAAQSDRRRGRRQGALDVELDSVDVVVTEKPVVGVTLESSSSGSASTSSATWA